MFTEHTLRTRLPIGGLGLPLHFFESVGSTNDMALDLAQGGAPHGALVVADTQTRGRGRGDRRWVTPAGTSLAFSVLLRPRLGAPQEAWGIGVAGALAVVDAMEMEGAEGVVKWPNDILLGGRKAAGLLVDALWEEDQLQAAIVGIGVNVLEGSAPPDDQVDFPATSLQAALGRVVDRATLLQATLEALARWLPRVGSADLRQAWWQRMAYRDAWVSVEDRGSETRGRLEGIDADGGVILRGESGETVYVGAGAGRLRPTCPVN
ncbi:MAG: biotin--[acetyl-CoA-carboxylase] ligase [Chloroflexi bacterium]|nr:biotin--[acetyl-CoA-carboxylase] ligase [Chloroflexota bacterium]